jgi:hypothetical protein
MRSACGCAAAQPLPGANPDTDPKPKPMKYRWMQLACGVRTRWLLRIETDLRRQAEAARRARALKRLVRLYRTGSTVFDGRLQPPEASACRS